MDSDSDDEITIRKRPTSIPITRQPKLELPITRPDRSPQLIPPSSSHESPLIISIRKNIFKAQKYEASSPWTTQSIYRVPQSLREIDEIAYTPHQVSIGPYHISNNKLHQMDQHKWRAIHHTLARTAHDIQLYVDVARSLETRARKCYQNLSLNTDNFVKLLVLDSIFTLELFLGVAKQEFSGYDPNDPVFSVRSNMYPLQRDMIMLENQLPLFVLDHILALQLGHDIPDTTLVVKLALNFFHPLRLTDKQLIDSSNPLFDAENYNEALHCLDVFRRSLILFPNRKKVLQIETRQILANKPLRQVIHSVIELRNAGVKFRRRRDSEQFWDINFIDGVLQIPHIRIHDSTKSVFLNLVAFEQSHLECSNHITSYVVFMGNLVNSEADVAYLNSKGIIEHWLGNDGEVADLFSRVSKEVVFDVNKYYLLDVSEKLNCYYNRRWNTWRAGLIDKYFSNPWTILSLVAAIVLLLLTFVQTFYAVYGYHKPN